MINAKIKIKALMKLIEDECQKEGMEFRTNVWGSCSWEGGIMELDETGSFIQREPMKHRRSTSGMTIKITFYDSDKPKELDERPKDMLKLLGDSLWDVLGDKDEPNP